MMSRVQDYKAAFDDLQKVKGVPVLTGEQLALDMALGSVENAA
jgi:hypothetical protein